VASPGFVALLRSAEHRRADAIHTLDLPGGNGTSDEEILSIAAKDSRIVIAKDSDFVTSFLLRRLPPKLLLISTGNIANSQLVGD